MWTEYYSLSHTNTHTPCTEILSKWILSFFVLFLGAKLNWMDDDDDWVTGKIVCLFVCVGKCEKIQSLNFHSFLSDWNKNFFIQFSFCGHVLLCFQEKKNQLVIITEKKIAKTHTRFFHFQFENSKKFLFVFWWLEKSFGNLAENFFCFCFYQFIILIFFFFLFGWERENFAFKENKQNLWFWIIENQCIFILISNFFY